MSKPSRTPTPFDPITDMLQWFDTTPFAHPRRLAGYVRIEDFTDDNKYVVRAELPGIDPDKDVEITVNGDLLTIRGERHEETRDKHHSEFHYGSFMRTVRLPAGSQPDAVTATYDNGVLEVVAPFAETSTPVQIPVVRTTS